MRTPLTWFNTIQNKKRTAAAVGGICFAILLIFMQWGFLGAARLNASLTYRKLDFDLIMVSHGYLTLTRSETISRFRLNQVRSVAGVAAVAPLSIDNAEWRNAATGSTTSCFVFGVSPDSALFVDPALNRLLPGLRGPLTMLVDSNARPSYGPWQVGGEGRVNRQTLTILGSYPLGMGLMADGSVMMSEDNYMRLYGRPDLPRVNFGLIKLQPGADPAAVAAAIRRALPADVMILTKPAIIHREERYFVSVKPVGIMFKVGMFVAFAVGAVILYQILASEITNRLREFATMKAMGYSEPFIYGIGIQQGVLFALLGYFPALVLSLSLYRILRVLSGFPVYMDWGRVFGVLGLSLAMCGVAAVFALGKIRRANPADLF